MSTQRIASAAALLLGLVAVAPALADGYPHGRARVGIGIQLGPGYGYPAYPYYPGYYATPPVVVVPSSPPQYIERGDEVQDGTRARQASPDWYHCDKPEGYYPYIQECPGGWTREPAEPVTK